MPRMLIYGMVLACVLGVTGIGAIIIRPALATPAAAVLVVSADAPVITPRLTLVQPQQTIIIRNHTPYGLDLRTTPHAPGVIRLYVPPRSSARMVLSTPGLYHVYDAATSYVEDYVAGNDVVRTRPHAHHPDLPDEGWIVVSGRHDVPIDAALSVPAGNDLFQPRAAVMQVGGTFIIHNHDGDAHNIVTDPADPVGAAFELFGTNDEPATGGAERRVTLTVAGLYHIYCSMHTRVAGMAGPWQVVVPSDAQASGYRDHNPMDAWILVVPEHVT